MFDPVSMGMFGVGAGLNVLGGFMAKDAANSAQGAMMSQIEMAQAASRAAAQQAAGLFSPYQLYGSGALSFLQSRLLSNNERQMAATSQRASLQADIDRLSQATDWNSMPILTGAKASERRASMWQQMEFDRKQQLAVAQGKLTAFDKEQSALAPFQAAQDAQMDETRGRINSALDLVAQSSNFNLPQSLSQLRNDMTNDPVFKFRQETGERAINRAAASRGNYLSGAAIASIGDFNNQLTADETDRYFNRLLTGKTTQMQAAMGGLNALVGANQTDVNNLIGLSQLGLNAAQGAANVTMQGNAANATLSGQAAQGMMQTELAKGQAMQSMMGGLGQMAGQLAGFSLMSGMMNKPTTTGPKDGVQNGTLTPFVRGGNQYLVNTPR
jgi:hypothetical protein